WAFLELHTSANSSDEKQAYAAGFLEGYCFNKIDVCGLIEEFVDSNENWKAWLLVTTPPRETPEGFLFGERCTGLVKLLPGLKELYTAQTTWNRKELIPGYKMSLSSYPAFVQILEYARAMVANRLARDGCEWVYIFQKYNSGTYNNQWYIVDYNMFKARTAHSEGAVSAGLLWVIEQLPGYTKAADLTDVLVRETYFPSYNIAYFPLIFNLSGGNVRAEIRSLRDMYRTMRYNDYKYAPYARCDACDPPYTACNAIAARNDLNPPNAQVDYRSLRDMYRTMRYNDYKYDPYARCDACDPPYTACNAIAARNDLNPP
ncbi:putative phospholipase B-like 2, partial [Operophtera brumata]